MGERVTVRTYSGYKADERPIAFTAGDRTVQVTEVIDRWYDLEANYFKVAGDDGVSHLLRHDLNSAEWELVESSVSGRD